MFMDEYNMDNVVKLVENEKSVESNVVKEDASMNKKLEKALFVWVDMDEIGKMNHRFERLLTGRWFDWGTHTSYTREAFVKILNSKQEGKEFDIYYA